MKFTVNNPVISGYNPDPSVCRVGDDFYLVNSTFEFFPGVPIYHSKNLVNWELIGHCLTRESQLPLRGCRNSGGIYAPTIRYHDGIFYMITTNVTDKGNFVVHTEDIRGEWSEPAWIDQDGIDPSLFWDDDGRCYYVGTGHHRGEAGIIAFELDPISGEILSEKHIISKGCGGKSPEGPHIYKKDSWYYLMLAEGGTEYGHSETMQRSRCIWGPYEACPHNPILTHSNLRAVHSEIQATGHADIVEDQHGRYWLVCLGIRRFGHELLHNLGRETFLAPVLWEEGQWPVVGDMGMLHSQWEMELPAEAKPQERGFEIPFDGSFSKRIMFTRNPDMENFTMEKGSLTLRGNGTTINEAGASPTVISFRQPDFITEFTAKLDLKNSFGTKYGISAYYNNDYHYDLYVADEDGRKFLCLYKHIHDFGAVVSRMELRGDEVELIIRSDRRRYSFFFRQGGEPVFIGSGATAGLSTEGTMTMTFTGTLYAAYCESGVAVFRDKFSVTSEFSPFTDDRA